jgi:hypothetical protein
VNITQLFDLQTNPHELDNLADQPKHADKVKEMLALMKKEMSFYDDPVPLEVAQPKPAEWTPPDKNTRRGRLKQK